MDESIHPQTRIGHVHLTVANLERCLNFYQEALGFKIHSREGDNARLGAGGEDLLLLTERKRARSVWGTTGLYHFAVLLPTRHHLAKILKHIADSHIPVEGFADHLVSEAIYLPDPEGNGIEIYRDRPREEWPRREDKLLMATEPLDVSDLMAEIAEDPSPWSGLPPETVIGHVHLHVADLEKAEAFYHGMLGFDLIARLGAAAGFVSAGGYHHHIGYNTWLGEGAPLPSPDAAGLRYFVIRLPSSEELEKVVEWVRSAGLQMQDHEYGVLVRDPSQNGMILSAR